MHCCRIMASGLRCVQASGATTSPARALELIDRTITSLETSLGLQPGEGFVSTTDGDNTDKGPAGGKTKPPRTTGAANNGTKKEGKGRGVFYLRCVKKKERNCARAYTGGTGLKGGIDKVLGTSRCTGARVILCRHRVSKI